MNFKRARGSTMIEVAVILPLFLIVVFATVEIYWVIHTKQMMYAAASGGARTLALSQNSATQAVTFTENFLSRLGIDGVTVTATDANCPTNETVTVALSVPLNDLTIVGDPFGIFSDTGNLEVSAFMLKECH